MERHIEKRNQYLSEKVPKASSSYLWKLFEGGGKEAYKNLFSSLSHYAYFAYENDIPMININEAYKLREEYENFENFVEAAHVDIMSTIIEHGTSRLNTQIKNWMMKATAFSR